MARATAPKRSEDAYKGYPIVDTRAEIRGMEGGFNKGASVQPVETDLDVFFAGKARKKGERYDFVCRTEDDGWRPYGPADDAPDGVVYVQIYTTLMAAFADEDLVGPTVHAVMEKVAAEEAERKRKQKSFVFPDPDDDEPDGEGATVTALHPE